MKPLLPAVLALLLAASLVLLHLSRQKIEDLETELAGVKAAHEKAAASAPAARPRGAATPSPTAPAKSTATTAPEKAAKDKEKEKEKDDDKADAADLLLGAGAKDIAARGAARIALLRDRLNLRPDQVAALEKAGAERQEAILAAFERLRQNKGTPPDLGIMMDWMLGNHDLPVSPLLDAEQAKTWAEMDQTERTGRVEGMVNMELLELQSQGGLHLTAEQKDQVFAALSGIVADEDALGAAYYADDGQFMARIDESLARRRAAMATVLDETMMQSYDKMVAGDREQIVALFGAGRKDP